MGWTRTKEYSTYRICKDISCAAWMRTSVTSRWSIDRDERFARRDLLGGKLDPSFSVKPIGNRVGSFQPYATAEPAAVRRGLPPEVFFTDLTEMGGGTHRHMLQFQMNATRNVHDEQPTTFAF